MAEVLFEGGSGIGVIIGLALVGIMLYGMFGGK
jgi:hypothetical protein